MKPRLLQLCTVAARCLIAAGALLLLASGPAAQTQSPPAHKEITYILPLWNGFPAASPEDTRAALDRLRASVSDARYVKAGFSFQIGINMTDWAVNTDSPAAVQAALATTFANIDAAVSKAQTYGIPICVYLLTFVRADMDAVQTLSELEDRRSMQWYSDNGLATGWWSHSRYARKASKVQAAYVKEVGRHLAKLMADYPETVVAAVGDGEVELSRDRSPVLADFSPFAIAEFRDWLRNAGMYASASGQPFAGEGYEAGAIYAQDDRPDQDTNGDGHTFNGDFNTSFTTWNLRLEDWSLADDVDTDPKAIPASVYGVEGWSPVVSNATGFDAPRVRADGDPWWELWFLFRQHMIWRHNTEFAKWITSEADPATGAKVPAERWFSAQIPADYLFAHSPTNRDLRYITSASPWWSADVSPYGGLGITAYNHNWQFDSGGGPYAKTLSSVAPLISARNLRWAIVEWNPSIPQSTTIDVYRDEMRLVQRYRPAVVMPFWWDSSEWPILGTPFETALGELVGMVNSPISCNFTPATSTVSAAGSGASGSVGVTVSAASGTDVTECAPWLAESDVSWIAISPASGTAGNGSFTYTVAPNTSPLTRTGRIAVGRDTITVTQGPVTLAWNKASVDLSKTVGITPVSQTATLTIGNGTVAWTAALSPNCDFLDFTPTGGIGNQDVTVSIKPGTLPFQATSYGGQCTLTATSTATPYYAQLTVNFTVNALPTLGWSSSTVDLSASVGVTSPKSVSVTSTGGNAGWTLAMSAGCDFLDFTPKTGIGTKDVTVSLVPNTVPFLDADYVSICTLTASPTQANPANNEAQVTIRLTVKAMATLAWNRLKVEFSASQSGSVLSPAQTVTLTSTGGLATWTLAFNSGCSYFSVAPTGGTGSKNVTLAIVPGSFPVQSSTYALDCTLTATTTQTALTPVVRVVQLPLRLTVQAIPQDPLPIGQVDTPEQNATGLVGAVGVTGWALDDLGIQNVKIYRNCLDFDDPAACQTIGDHSVVLLGTAAFLTDARPDVEALFPNNPAAYRAGWGFLVLTSMLPHIPNRQGYGGQGTLALYVFATDVEGNVKLLGRSYDKNSPVYQTPTTITMDNDTIGKPFGAIDTPGQGQTVSGLLNNFGWALTPDSNTTAGDAADILIPTNGSTMFVFIDGQPVATVAYNNCRGTVGNPVPGTAYCDDDVASIFGNPTPQAPFTPRVANPTKHRNLDVGRAAIGAYQIDTTQLTDGNHTIAWSVTDSAGRTEGIGSRFFTVANATSGARPEARASAVVADDALQSTPVDVADIYGRSGFDLSAPWQTIPADGSGARAVRIPELGRLELWLGTDVTEGYLRTRGTLRPLPMGSRLEGGRFTWAPPAGFIGAYDLVFVGGSGQVPAQVTVAAAAPDGASPIDAWIDLPSADGAVIGPFTVAGWAIDNRALAGAGVGAVHVWAFPTHVTGVAPTFLGAAALEGYRPDVAAQYGAQFERSGWSLTAPALPPGDYDVVAYVWSARTGRFEDARTVRVRVR